VVAIAAPKGFLERVAEVSVYLLATEDADQTTDESTCLAVHSVPHK